MLETVNHFQQNNTDVYVLLLDASKAFDKVNYVKLSDPLLERGVEIHKIKGGCSVEQP